MKYDDQSYSDKSFIIVALFTENYPSKLLHYLPKITLQGFGGNLSQLFFVNNLSILLRPDKYNIANTCNEFLHQICLPILCHLHVFNTFRLQYTDVGHAVSEQRI